MRGQFLTCRDERMYRRANIEGIPMKESDAVIPSWGLSPSGDCGRSDADRFVLLWTSHPQLATYTQTHTCIYNMHFDRQSENLQPGKTEKGGRWNSTIPQEYHVQLIKKLRQQKHIYFWRYWHVTSIVNVWAARVGILEWEQFLPVRSTWQHITVSQLSFAHGVFGNFSNGPEILS